ncbi:MAG: beta-ketoacyl synthase N-terminal-like domain-containing protein [Cyanophyceae cyanobacterium]
MVNCLTPKFCGAGTTLVDLLRHRSQFQPNCQTYRFLKDGETIEQCLTNRELERQARAIAAHLQGKYNQGERVVLLLPPGTEYVAAFFGCLYAGAIAVPLYPPRSHRRSLSRLQAIIQDAQPRTVLTNNALRADIQGKELGVEELDWLTTDTLALELAAQWQDPHLTGDALAFLQYTSGSTAAPKGVMVSHQNLLHNLALIHDKFGFSPESQVVSWLPPYHDMGLIGGLLEPLYASASVTFMSPVAFLQQPIRWLQAIAQTQATVSGGPNFAYDLCCQRISPEMLSRLDLSCWKVAFNGAEPLRAETLERFTATFADCGFQKTAFYPCYGMAEATLFVTGGDKDTSPRYRTVEKQALRSDHAVVSDKAEGTQTLVSCGRGAPHVVVVNPDLRPCAPNSVGEIWVAGASVTQGYWNQPKATTEAFQAYLAEGEGPFLKTGDLGFFNDGELFITGRLKDLIIIRGQNYYPQDIERTVEQAHPALRAANGAAFTIEEAEMVIVSEVERQVWRNLNVEEIARAIREAIVYHHDLPIYAIALLKPGGIPKTSSGKIQRRACKQQFLDQTLAVIGEWTAAQPEDRPAGNSQPSIQTWLVEQVARAAHLDPSQIEPHQSFASYGIDSVNAVRLSGELEQRLQQRLSPTLLYDYPTIAALSQRLADGTEAEIPRVKSDRPLEEAIAIIGLGCRFPGAENPEAFWHLLHTGGDAITSVPRERWDVEAYYAEVPTPGKMTTRWGGFLNHIAQFDASFFGITPREAEKIDPQQRLLLEVAWEALEHAGTPPEHLAESSTGVFIGTSGSDYARLLAQEPACLDAYLGTGTAASIAANRLSYCLNLQGPSLAIDTACSSSLVAVHLASQSLRQGECDLALAGGVNLLLTPELTVAFSQARMLAADGRCKTFDAAADGYGRSEGCGIVILKRLADAQRDGDRILAVVRGSAINQDGHSNGLSAPNGLAQQTAIRQALNNAGIDPAHIQYVEAHGTGTALGDPIEMKAIQAALGNRPEHQPCVIGSVKTNIGHLEAAAGIAGLIKVVLSLQHQEIPPHLHLNELNPHIALDGTPFTIATQGQPWKDWGRRLAGVSSFGFGGTNAHLVVEGEPASPQRESNDPERPLHVLTLSAKTDAALRQLVERYCPFLSTSPHSLGDICFTANAGRSSFAHRVSFVASSKEHLQSQLQGVKAGEEFGFVQKQGQLKPKIAFLFSGQGTQLVNMGRQLYETQPTFRKILEHCDAILRADLKPSLLAVLYPEPSHRHLLQQTAYTQPALFALEYALAKLWQSWGIQPDGVMGHSVGEYVAACLAGVFDLEDGLKLVAARGRLMQSLPDNGAMVVAAVEAERAAAIVADAPVAIAAINGPRNTVLSGLREDVQEIATHLAAAGIRTTRLQVANGFHSALMEPVLKPFRAEASKIPWTQPRINLVSNLTGQWATEAIATPEYWVKHIRQPVRFSQGMETLHREGYRWFLEIGAKPTLLGLGRQCLPPALADTSQWLPSLRPSRSDWQVMLTSLGRLASAGFKIDWRGFDRDYRRQLVSVPTYPFERQSYWFQRSATVRPPLGSAASSEHPLLGKRLAPLAHRPSDRLWTVNLNGDRLSYLGEHQVWGTPTLFLGAYIEMALAAARETWGERRYQLRDLALHQPLFLSRDGNCQVQIALLEQSPDSATFQTHSRTCSAAASPWILHATATLHWSDLN